MLAVKICSLDLLILRKVLNSIMTGCAFLISRLLWLCTHVRPSTFSGPPVACVAGVWKGTGRGFRARGLAPKLPSLSFSNACQPCYAKASLPRACRCSFGSSRNLPQRGEGTLDKALISDRPFDFWGGGGMTVWLTSEKNILQTDFKEKKFSQGNNWRKKFLHSWRIILFILFHGA